MLYEVITLDSTLSNPNPLVQLNTGYTQTDLLQKFRFSPNTKTDWLLNLQYSTSSDIDRLDMLNNYKDGNLQYAEYYYGPQNRLLVSLKHVYRGNTRLFTTANTIFAVQKIDEDRYTRKFRSDELMVQQEDVMVYTLTSDLNLEFNPAWQLNYGLDFSFNTVESTACVITSYSIHYTKLYDGFADLLYFHFHLFYSVLHFHFRLIVTGHPPLCCYSEENQPGWKDYI